MALSTRRSFRRTISGAGQFGTHEGPDFPNIVMNPAVVEMSRDAGWLVSPLSCALALSAREGENFQAAPHLKLISDAIVDAFNGAGQRFIIVSMPPQHGK